MPFPTPPTPSAAQPPGSTQPNPVSIAHDLAALVRLGQAMRAETIRLQHEQDAFWHACRARAAHLAASRLAAAHLAAPHLVVSHLVASPQ
jgi:hypothetical protein